jgi:hypothetical protein
MLDVEESRVRLIYLGFFAIVREFSNRNFAGFSA